MDILDFFENIGLGLTIIIVAVVFLFLMMLFGSLIPVLVMGFGHLVFILIIIFVVGTIIYFIGKFAKDFI